MNILRQLTWRLIPFLLAYSFFVHVSECGNIMVSPNKCFVKGGVAIHKARSTLECSSMCISLRGFAYMFRDGMCEVRGVGLGTLKKSMKFSPIVLEEVSRGKTPLSSEPYSDFYAEIKAIDDSDKSFFSNKNGVPQPWWALDLREVNLIHTVVILPMYVGFGRFNDIGVFVGTQLPADGDFTKWPMLDHYQGPYSSGEGRVNFTCTNLISGRYVAVQRVSITYEKLELRDVRVYVIRYPA
ncbi:uncharacterized protein LOC125027800 [Penaeus chinensis]|uniref:uncharacterized protein LOC125027800 n=1 Tax=Penaeus chinensis TaxID=139456 RepID=UPI001FB80274|nr:uncharacterized protein LOC125027800 [Penaeus chinensis]